jgi:hypothetical protein
MSGFAAPPLLAAPVAGSVAIVLEDGAFHVDGWACAAGEKRPLAVEIMAAAASEPTPVATVTGQYLAEKAIDDTCGGEATYRFRLNLPPERLATLAGSTLVARARAADRNGSAEELQNSGILTFPQPLDRKPPGCALPVYAGPGPRNAYPTADTQAQGDSWIYKAWVWRQTPDVATNHTLAVARTKDLRTWYNTCGQKLEFPFTLQSAAVLDPLQPGQGLANKLRIGFDDKGRPVVSYRKYRTTYSSTAKPVVTSQVYNARLLGERWEIRQMTQWTVEGAIKGGGSLPATDQTMDFYPVTTTPDGAVVQRFTRPKADRIGTPATGTWLLDDDLHVTKKVSSKPSADSFTIALPVGLPADRSSLEPREAGWRTPYRLLLRGPAVQRDAIVIRGNWDGDGPRGGLYLQKTRTFVLQRSSGPTTFAFGPSDKPLYPLVGDWDGDGRDTIGVIDPVTRRYALRNALEGGAADISGTADGAVADIPGASDGPMVANRLDPAILYRLRYEQLPTNRDRPYSCTGVALAKKAPDIVETCPQKFVSRMVLNEFDIPTKQWLSTHVDDIWAGSSAGIHFAVFGRHQIIAYYDRDRRVKIAMRSDREPWRYQILDERFGGWDSHNYLTLAIDENLDMHLSGNLHANPLNYWRSEGLALNFRAVEPMVAGADPRRERMATYPRFFRGPKGEFLFTFRDGGSGNGNWLINVYDVRTKTWSRFVEKSFDNR